jgi:hypothetical protein
MVTFVFFSLKNIQRYSDRPAPPFRLHSRNLLFYPRFYSIDRRQAPIVSSVTIRVLKVSTITANSSVAVWPMLLFHCSVRRAVRILFDNAIWISCCLKYYFTHKITVTIIQYPPQYHWWLWSGLSGIAFDDNRQPGTKWTDHKSGCFKMFKKLVAVDERVPL